MSDKTRLSIHIFDEFIVVSNNKGREKRFPRCGITQVEMFVLDLAKQGELNELAT